MADWKSVLNSSIDFEEVRDDEVGADADQALALPLVHFEALGLVGRDADCDAADLLDVLDLDIAVAEAEELVASEGGRGDDALDQDRLREALVVVERAVDTGEVAVHVEQLRFLLHVRLVGAAGEIHRVAAFAQSLEQRARAGHQILFGRAMALSGVRRRGP